MKIKNDKHERRNRNILEQQSQRSGKFRLGPNERAQAQAERAQAQAQAVIQKTREQRENEIQLMVNKIAHWTSPKIYAGNVNRSWAEVFLGCIQALKLDEHDQQEVVEDLYFAHNPERKVSFDGYILDEAISVSESMIRVRSEIMSHWKKIQANRKNADDFHSALEAL